MTATYEIEWKVWWRDIDQRVRGFKDPFKARDHAKRHFLSAREHWEQIVSAGSAPAVFEQKLDQVELGHHAPVLDEAADAYVKAVKGNSAANVIAEAGFATHDDGVGGRYRSLMLASKRGVFAAFVCREVSQLSTAYRPRPTRGVRGIPSEKDYARAAREKLHRKLQ